MLEFTARVVFCKTAKHIDATQISNIPRILGIMETSFSNMSMVVEIRTTANSKIFWIVEHIKHNFSMCPRFWSANLIFGVHFSIRFRLEMNLIMTPRNYNNYPRSM